MDKLLKVESTDIYIFSLILEPFQNLVLYSNYMMSSQQVFLGYGSYISGALGGQRRSYFIRVSVYYQITLNEIL